MARNPIDHRHGNRKDFACPVFWRNWGNGFALFLALYPWIVAAVALLVAVIRRELYGTAGLWMPSPQSDIDIIAWALLALPTVLYQFGILFFPLGLLWYGGAMGVAWWSGFVSGRRWVACAALGGVGLTVTVFGPMIASGIMLWRM